MRHSSQTLKGAEKHERRVVKENPLENCFGKLVKAFGMLEKG